MAYKHTIQKNSPHLLYPLDTSAIQGVYSSFGTIENLSASIVNSSDVFSSLNVLPSYNSPLVRGNNISTYIDSNKKIKVSGLGFFTKKNEKRTYSIEFWMRHYGNNYNTPTRIVSASSSSYSGLWMDGQYLIYRYGDSLDSVQEVSLPVEKYDLPIHVIMTYSPTSISLSINRQKKVREFEEGSVTLSAYDSNKDFLFFGSVNNLELCNIALYKYNILKNTLISTNHYLYGQGYDVNTSQYEIRGGTNNTMSLENSSPKTVFSAKQIFNGTENVTTWKNYDKILQFGTIISDDYGLTVPDFDFQNIYYANGITPSSNTSSGMAIEKGSYIEFSRISSESENFSTWGSEISFYHPRIPAASSSNTLVHLRDMSSLAEVWVYSERQTSTTSIIKYTMLNRSGSIITSSSLTDGNNIPVNAEFKIGFGKTKNLSNGNEQFYLYRKYNSVTSSVAINLDPGQYDFLSTIDYLRIGSKNTYDETTSISEITNDFSWQSPSIVYVNSIVFGEASDIISNSYSNLYRKYQFDITKNRFMPGIYNAKAIIPISFWDFGVETNSSYEIYPNKIEFSFPNQTGSLNAIDSIKIEKHFYSASTLTSSSRIFNQLGSVIAPTTYSNKNDVSSSAVHIVISFNEKDIILKKPALNELKIFSMKDNLLTSSRDMVPIQLKYTSGASVSIPQYQKTPFINNSISDAGIYIGTSSYYGLINLSTIPVDQINTISFFVKSPSAQNSTILQINGTNLFLHVLNGASAFVNNTVASIVYLNGASVSIASGSVAAQTTDWNRYDIVLKTPLSINSNIIIGASGAVSNNPFYIDEFAIFKKAFTDSDAAKIFNLYEYGFTSSFVIKDGASATINMTDSYGSSSSAKVMLSLYDKETSASTAKYTDGIQLTAKQNLSYVRAFKINNSETTTSPNTFTSNRSERYVDGIELVEGDKVLYGSQIYQVNLDSNKRIRFIPSSSVTTSSIIYIKEGRMFGKKYYDGADGLMDKEIAKIKYLKRRR